MSMKITDFISQQLRVAFERNVGISRAINFSDDITTTYGIKWQLAPKWSFDGQVMWLKANESGDKLTGSEIGETFTTTVGVSHLLSKYSSLSFAYRRTDKYSNVVGDDREYDKNEVTFNFNYDF